jgi:hypothetical protein
MEKNPPTSVSIHTNYVRSIRSLEMVTHGSVFLLVISTILFFSHSTCQAAAFAFSLRLCATLHLACSTCIDASSTFDGTAAQPLTSTTLPRHEVVEVATARPRRTSTFFEGTVSSFLDVASSFPNIGHCFLDDTSTRSSNPARLLLAPANMAASSTTTRLLLSTTTAFLHGGRAWRCGSSSQVWSHTFNNDSKHPHPHRGMAPI